ncbi:MAG TPA: hypothetical protein VGX78_05520, partial [Pirellulales bacterium]|nr:hypothetical protein [Pirellulales bacterium]
MLFSRLFRAFRSSASRNAKHRRPALGRSVGQVRLGSGFEGLEERQLLTVSPTATFVADIFPGPTSSNPSSLAALNGNTLFAATDPTYGTELWISDGTLAGTRLVKDINPTSTNTISGPVPNSSFPTDLVTVGGEVYFAANDGTDGTQLWKTDGTTNGT